MTTGRTPFTPAHAGGTVALGTRAVAGTSDIDETAPFVPETEALTAGEIRVTILGSGSPWLTRAQAGGSVLMEVGNASRDIFVFDLGSGALANFSGLRLPMTNLKRLFLSHLHADHMADYIALMGSYSKAGRLDAVEVWGGGADTPELGLGAFVDAIDKALAWNLASMMGMTPTSGTRTIAHEVPFDRSEVIYERDDVRITSFPVIHGLNGAVGYRLDYSGRSIVFSGDTTPSWTVVEAARDCDLLIHDTALPPEIFSDFMQVPLDQAERVVNHGHTTAAAAGVVFGEIGPKMAAMWHCQVIEGFIEPIFAQAARGFDGPTVLCQDLTVFNVTEGGVTARQAQVAPVTKKVIGASDTERLIDPKPVPPGWWREASMDWRRMLEREENR
jgi:ribonuclease Z